MSPIEKGCRAVWSFSLVALCIVVGPAAFAQGGFGDGRGSAPIEVTLNNSFIEAHKNRATADVADFLVDLAHDRPNPPSKDGDLHVAGRSATIGLPLVVELMNAKTKKPLVDLLNAREGSPDPVPLSGAWRLWPEHGGLDPQVQGDPVSPATTTNPEHVFELHPVTKVNGQAVLDTLKEIDGFTYKSAEDAFQRYESAPFQLRCDSDTTTFRTKMIGYNYVDFEVELLEDPTHVVADGLSLFANVRDPDDGELLVYKRRVWFVKGSGPYAVVAPLKAGDRIRVVGIPRINLSLISWRCANAERRPDVLQWALPYELVIVDTE